MNTKEKKLIKYIEEQDNPTEQMIVKEFNGWYHAYSDIHLGILLRGLIKKRKIRENGEGFEIVEMEGNQSKLF